MVVLVTLLLMLFTQKHKIIVLEDLAKAFKLKTASAIERVQQLEEMVRRVSFSIYRSKSAQRKK